MSHDPLQKRLFEMRLAEIYHKHDWLSSDLTEKEFIKLFPIYYKGNKALSPDSPMGYDLDRQIFLEVLVAFRQSFK